MTKSLTYLGRPTPPPASPDEAVLDRVPNAHPRERYLVRFTAPEFTCLCPITGQPDFAHLVIDYVPKAWLIESKALKLYLASFRNHNGFHESTTIDIAPTSNRSPGPMSVTPACGTAASTREGR